VRDFQTTESVHPEGWLEGRKSTSIFEVSGTPSLALENLEEAQAPFKQESRRTWPY